MLGFAGDCSFGGLLQLGVRKKSRTKSQLYNVSAIVQGMPKVESIIEDCRVGAVIVA